MLWLVNLWPCCVAFHFCSRGNVSVSCHLLSQCKIWTACHHFHVQKASVLLTHTMGSPGCPQFLFQGKVLCRGCRQG